MAKTDLRTAAPTPALSGSADARPSLWPHWPAESEMPAGIDSRLASADACAALIPARAAELIDEALAIGRQARDPTVLPRCLHQAAEVLLKSRNVCDAYVMCLEAQPLLERLDDRWRATQVLHLRGRCFFDVGEHDLAEALLLEASDRFDKMGSPVQSARCKSLLSAAHRRQGNLLAAVHFAARARLQTQLGPLELIHRLGADEAYCRLVLARRLRAAGDALSADGEMAEAAAVVPDPSDVDATSGNQGARVLDVIAMVEDERGRKTERRRALRRLMVVGRRVRDPETMGLIWLRLSELRLAQGRLTAALKDARRAIGSLCEAPGSPLLASAERLLASVQERRGDWRGAYDAFSSALRHEAKQQRALISSRLELLALHTHAERDLRQTEPTLAYAQRFSNVGYLVASVNHELNQPLASIRLLAETTMELAQHGHTSEVQESLRSMFALSGRLSEMASKLAAFPVRENVPTKRLALQSVIDEALVLLQSRLAQNPCEISQLCEDAYVQADEAQVVHVIANLVNNAIDAMTAQGDRRIHFSCRTGAEMVTLTIRDTGPGIAQSVLERLFHPFFSTKAAGQGLGLGLALSRDALRAMGGDLALSTQGQTGAAFQLSLPRALSGRTGRTPPP